MASKKSDPKEFLPINLLLLAVISALFVLFVYLLKQRPVIYDETSTPAPTVKPVNSVKELDIMLDELNKTDANTTITSELQKLSSDSSGI